MINLYGKVEDLKFAHGQSSETFSKHTRPVRARAITRERTEMTRLMMNEDYLHLLKSGLHNISDLFKKYQNIHHEYWSALSKEEERNEKLRVMRPGKGLSWIFEIKPENG